MKKWVFLLAVFFAMSATPSVHATDVHSLEGKTPPNFTLLDENGRMVELNSLLTKPTVIYFTHNACHYCTQVLYHMKNAYKKYGAENFQVLGINVMAKDTRLIKAYKENLGFIFPMFAGNRQDVLKAYYVNYVPILLFVGKDKVIKQVVAHYIHEPELIESLEYMMGKGPKPTYHLEEKQ